MNTRNASGRPAGKLNRRSFLTKGLAFVAVGSVMPAAFVRAVSAAEVGDWSADSTARRPRSLVIVQLGGGNDGLNTVIPYADGAYYDARGELAVNPEAMLPLNDRLALHPSLGPLKALYDRGRLAIVEGVGYPNPNRSHFRSMEIWHAASTDSNVRDGWLGRLLDVTASDNDSRWRAANVGEMSPAAFDGGESFVPSLRSVPSYVLQTDPWLRDSISAQRRTTDWAQLYAQQAAAGGALAMISETGLNAYQSTIELGEDVADYQPLVDYPDSPLGKALLTCAQLMGSGLGTHVCYVTTGGFDSHSEQDSTHPELLTAVAEALAAFEADLEAHGTADDVSTLVWTEFGRRVRGNGSGGTDHGTAGPVFVLGGSVQGGLYGEPASLNNLDENGDLRFTTDFRSVYATMIEQWLGADADGVLGARYPQLPIFG